MKIENNNSKFEKVCDICGALQTMNDTDKRTQTHLEGKLHTGFVVLRKELENLKNRKEELRNNIGFRPKKDEKKEKDRLVVREFRGNYDNRRKNRSRSNSKNKDSKGRKYDNGDRHKRHRDKSRSRSKERDRRRRE